MDAMNETVRSWIENSRTRRAAIRPTFWPGTAERAMVDALPMCWWLPPP